MTNTMTSVILKPVFTEKSEALKYADKKKYYFLVNIDANKAEIRNAFMSIYLTEPEAINIIRRKPVWIRTGTRHPGYSKAKKIAIITLPKGVSLAMTDDEVKDDKKEQKFEKKQMTSTRKVVSDNDESKKEESK